MTKLGTRAKNEEMVAVPRAGSASQFADALLTFLRNTFSIIMTRERTNATLKSTHAGVAKINLRSTLLDYFEGEVIRGPKFNVQNQEIHDVVSIMSFEDLRAFFIASFVARIDKFEPIWAATMELQLIEFLMRRFCRFRADRYP